jgi:hypothetical protein
MKEKTWIATLGLIGSLSLYYYAKKQGKDAVPYTMIGGFLGALAGELIASSMSEEKQKNELNP